MDAESELRGYFCLNGQILKLFAQALYLHSNCFEQNMNMIQ